MMAKVPPGRSILKASAIMACEASWGSSCITKQIDTRSTLLSSRPVRSAAACLNLHVVMTLVTAQHACSCAKLRQQTSPWQPVQRAALIRAGGHYPHVSPHLTSMLRRTKSCKSPYQRTMDCT